MKIKVNLLALLGEFFGTFTLVFLGGFVVLSSQIDQPILIPAFGHAIIIYLIVYFSAPLSGAHFNPAVTLALLSTQHIDPVNAVLYIISQFAASFAAGGALHLSRPQIFYKFSSGLGYPHIPLEVSEPKAFFAEAVGTFYLMLTVYYFVFYGKESKQLFGASIGIVVFLDVLCFGAITGAAFNPIRAIGPSVVNGELYYRGNWIYLVAPVVGSLSASIFASSLNYLEQKGGIIIFQMGDSKKVDKSPNNAGNESLTDTSVGYHSIS